jgi:hypothetical protein
MALYVQHVSPIKTWFAPQNDIPSHGNDVRNVVKSTVSYIKCMIENVQIEMWTNQIDLKLLTQCSEKKIISNICMKDIVKYLTYYLV